jgi:hypothetical protein
MSSFNFVGCKTNPSTVHIVLTPYTACFHLTSFSCPESQRMFQLLAAALKDAGIQFTQVKNGLRVSANGATRETIATQVQDYCNQNGLDFQRATL